MNRYGKLAMDHWRETFPDRFSQISDPQIYFSTLGQQVATQIADLAATLSNQSAPTGDYLANLANGRNARTRAEEIVLAQQVYLSEETDDQDSETTPPASGPDWIPLTEDLSHPWWKAERDTDE